MATVSESSAAALDQLSLEDLLSSDVTSVAKKRQSVSDAAAAVFVITQDDIRRSGAVNVPEVLRMAPGVEVAALGGSGYAVSIRGFNGRFSNKLLVLIDGRTIYLSTLSSVRWEEQLVPLQDIERIEVVRGPGGAIWGANAVDGVINIITKHAVDTQGGFVSAKGDTEGNGQVLLRYGFRVGGTGTARVYATTQDKRLDGYGIDDRSDGSQAGFRYDVEPSEKDAVTLQGDADIGDYRTADAPRYDAAFAVDGGHYSGANLLGRWNRQLDQQATFTLQAYYDRVALSEFYGTRFQRSEYDVETSENIQLGARQNIVAGLEYRRDWDEVSHGVYIFNPASRAEDWYGGFVQDEITLLPHLKLQLGGKLEHNVYTGLEFQPSARAIWKDDHWSAWTAVSRAVRTPSRFEADLAAPQNLALAPASQLAEMLATSNVAEDVVAYEIGWRGALGAHADLDVTSYYNSYDHLLSHAPIYPVGEDFLPISVASDPVGVGHSSGVEAALNVRPTPRWTLKLAADYLNLRIITNLPAPELDVFTDQALSPKTQLSLRSWFDLTPDIDADIWFRYIDQLERSDTPAYTDLDLRLAWRINGRLEVVAAGQNLLTPKRFEMGAVGAITPTFMPRIGRLGLEARF